MANKPPSKAVEAADMVYRFSIGDLDDPLAKAYLLARTLVHLGYNAYVTESSLFPVFLTVERRSFMEAEADSESHWLIDLQYPDGPKFIAAEMDPPPEAMILEFKSLPWNDLDAFAQLIATGEKFSD
jgi:hypothetical protein